MRTANTHLAKERLRKSRVMPMRFRDRMYVVFAVWALALVALAMAV